MKTNEYGMPLDRAGYAPSILQSGRRCALCGRSNGKLDRHEPWGGNANRSKSKELGMWVWLCHIGCHEGPGSVHADAQLARSFRAEAQREAMLCYGWSREEFIARFGRNELDEEPQREEPQREETTWVFCPALEDVELPY